MIQRETFGSDTRSTERNCLHGCKRKFKKGGLHAIRILDSYSLVKRNVYRDGIFKNFDQFLFTMDIMIYNSPV
jgi:hypothetical protein